MHFDSLVDIVMSCEPEITKGCGGLNTKEQGGVIHCLMGMARPGKNHFQVDMSNKCKAAVSKHQSAMISRDPCCHLGGNVGIVRHAVICIKCSDVYCLLCHMQQCLCNVLCPM